MANGLCEMLINFAFFSFRLFFFCVFHFDIKVPIRQTLDSFAALVAVAVAAVVVAGHKVK